MIYQMFCLGKRSKPTQAMLEGLVFEEELIGSARGHEKVDAPKQKNGEPYKWERDVRGLANKGKKLMKDMGIKIVDVQPEWVYDGMVYHLDAIMEYNGELAVLDVKFTSTRVDEAGKYGWGDPTLLDHTQAIHYTLGSIHHYDRPLPFYYIVFGKSGWVKFIQVKVSKETMVQHVEVVKRLMDYMANDFEPTPTKSYNKCARCLLRTVCDKRVEIPDTEIVVV